MSSHNRREYAARGQRMRPSVPLGPQTSIDDLPDELLLFCLSKLPLRDLCHVRRVSRRWTRIGSDNTLWGTLDATSLALRPLPSWLRHVIAITPFKKCLRALNLEGVVTLLNDVALAGLPAQLERVNWSHDSERSVVRGRQPGEDDENFAKLTDASVVALVFSCPRLQELRLHRCGLITDVSLQTLAGGCPQLRRLGLGYCTSFTDVGLMALVLGCTQLQELDLWCCRQITDDSIACLGQGCPNLSQLSVGKCLAVGDDGLRALGACTALTNLELAWCWRITNAGVRFLAQCPLRTLNLHQCDRITDESIEHLVDLYTAPDDELTLPSEGFEITDYVPAHQQSYSHHHNHPQDADHEGDESQRPPPPLCRSVTALTSLDLSECRRVSEQGVLMLAQQCTQLRKLKLGGCEDITDEGVEMVIGACPNLEELDVRWQGVTNRALAFLRENPPLHLRLLNLEGCMAISDPALKSLQSACPNLQLVV